MFTSLSGGGASLQIQGRLRETTDKLSSTYEKLSSGLRINSAKDDPAGLVVADLLRRDARIASVAVRNANDGLSLAAIADAGLDEIQSLLLRMAELAEQSANGVYSAEQRSALSGEFVALGSEIERISRVTTFNSLPLLSAGSSVTFQIGLDGSAASRITVEAVEATLASLGLAGSGSSALSFSIIASTSTASQLAAQNALNAVTAAVSKVGVSRGVIGAAESRLSSAVEYLRVARENFVAAESRIRDADVAEEAAELVRLQVLQEAQTAVLAQANQQPERVLDLLK